MSFDRRNPPRALIIVFILVIAVVVGFLGDLCITAVEKLIYPRDYASYVETYAELYDVPENLVYALIKCESDFDSGAVSKKDCVGLCQLHPDTFLWLTDEILFDHLEPGMLYDPETNIRYGVYYLGRLYGRYGSWEVALAAYNAGPGNVDGWLENPEYADGEGGLRHIPFRETRLYVKKVMWVWETYDRLWGTGEPEVATGFDTESAP